MFHRWGVHIRHKEEQQDGKSKRGKGTKLMAVAGRSDLPVAIHTESASPYDIKLAKATLEDALVSELPRRLIGDSTYDSDPLDALLRKRGER